MVAPVAPNPFKYGTGGLPAVAPQNPFAPLAPAATPGLNLLPGVQTQGPTFGMGTPAPVVPAPPAATATTTTTPTKPATAPYAPSAVYAGMAAAAPAAQAYDAKSAAVSVAGATASGALAGGIVGGVPGALVGGGVGLITGGLNAYLSVSDKRRASRERKRILADAEAKQNARDKIARDDALSQLAHDREQTMLQKRWAKNQQVRGAIAELVAGSTDARDRYVRTGRK